MIKIGRNSDLCHDLCLHPVLETVVPYRLIKRQPVNKGYSDNFSRAPRADSPNLCASKIQSLIVRGGTESQVTETQNQRFCASFSALTKNQNNI